MTDARREALAALAESSDLAPEIRIGQLVAHLGMLSEDDGGRGLGDTENNDLLKVIARHRSELLPLTSNSPDQPLLQSGGARPRS